MPARIRAPRRRAHLKNHQKLGLLPFPLEDPHIDVDEDLRLLFEPPPEDGDGSQKDGAAGFLPLFEPPPEDGDGSQKDGAAGFLPLFEPPPELQKDGAAGFLPLFEPPPKPQKDLDGGAGLLFPLLFAGGDALDTGCESGELGTRSTTYRFPQLRFRFF